MPARSDVAGSHGILVEDSIQRAYRQMIAESSHCIYIENQFFCSAATPGGNSILKNGCAVPLSLQLTPSSVAQAIGEPALRRD